MAMRRTARTRSAQGVFLVCRAAAFALRAQTVTGRIVGVVEDTNGGAVWNAQVTILNQETGLKWSYPPDARGSYGAPSLPLGGYRIQVHRRSEHAMAV